MKRNYPRRQKVNIVEVIRNRYDDLGKTYKKIAEFILNNLEAAAFVSLGELSRQTGVSDVTLIRFARELGYVGYQDFREDLVSYIRRIIYPSQKIVMSIGQKKIPTLDIVKQADIDFIHQTINGLHWESFDHAIRLILSAKRIFCMGWGLSAFLAEFLSFQLKRLSFESYPITRDRRPMIEQVLFLKTGDLLIAFDLLVYSSEVLESIEYLHNNNKDVKIVTITNDSVAHIVQYANISLFCHTLGPKKSTLISLTAPMCLINCILEEIIIRKPRQAVGAIRRFQQEVLSNNRYYSQFEFSTLK